RTVTDSSGRRPPHCSGLANWTRRGRLSGFTQTPRDSIEWPATRPAMRRSTLPWWRISSAARLDPRAVLRFPLSMTTAVREERKVLTAVFADVVGSTALAERLDPEDVKLVRRCGGARSRRGGESRGGCRLG